MLCDNAGNAGNIKWYHFVIIKVGVGTKNISSKCRTDSCVPYAKKYMDDTIQFLIMWQSIIETHQFNVMKAVVNSVHEKLDTFISTDFTGITFPYLKI